MCDGVFSVSAAAAGNAHFIYRDRCRLPGGKQGADLTLNSYRLGFIGAGNMASAIVGGILAKGLIPADHIMLADPMADKLDNLKKSGGQVTADNKTAARWSDFLILAVKPQVYDAVLDDLTDCVGGKCMISIAPGISTGYLKKHFSGAYVVRVMPNTPLLIGMGATAIAQADIPAEKFEFIKLIFTAAGEAVVIPESQMNAIVAVSGSSPAYFFRMADAVVSEAQRQGIDPDVALLMAARTMEGSARMLLQSGKTAQELTRQVCSPGGTTLAALTAFDEMGFDGIISEAMKRCTARSIELGK
jgi:pyrroline-5-carboxylate reductase